MKTVAVIGLGYVGLPLSIEFGKKFNTIGIDLNQEKINAYLKHNDPAAQIDKHQFEVSTHVNFSTDFTLLSKADYIVIAVPTPIGEASQPNFTPLIKASEAVGRHMQKGALIIYESTVYPGATEEKCIPVLEQYSGMKWKKDFNVGYSPERVNPSDKEHTLTTIVKVVSGDSSESLERVAKLYESIITAGVHRANSIKVAEAAKVIENTQRDLNIALMNELAIIFNAMQINSKDVLKAAETKWNFLPFKPGLVGGHCIGVDPYYLTYKAELLNYHPQVILAGRRINDNMGKFIAEQTIKQMIKNGNAVKGAKVTILGLTFKENCSDIRNTKVIDVINELKEYNVFVSIHDPIANPQEAYNEYGLELSQWDDLAKAEAVILAVPHRQYLNQSDKDLLSLIKPSGCLIDVKSVKNESYYTDKGISIWQL